MNEIVPFSDIQKMAQVAVASRLFGVKTEAEALALMLLAQSEGMHPMTAVRQYHIVQGRPAMKAEAMLARFQAAGGKVQWVESTDEKASASFQAPGTTSWLTVEWTMERAAKAGLASKDNWKSYAPAMLRARVVSEGVRATFPGCTLGIMADEELADSPISSDGPAPVEVVVGATVRDTVANLQPATTVTHKELGDLVSKIRAAGIADSKAMEFITSRVHRPIDRLSQLSQQEILLLISELEELQAPVDASE